MSFSLIQLQRPHRGVEFFQKYLRSDDLVAGDSTSNWLIWCGLPVAAGLLAFSRTSLWLTAPAASELQALNWVEVAEGFAVFALGAGQNIRVFAARFVAATIFLIVGWAATDAAALMLAWSLAAAGAVMAVTAVFDRRLPNGRLTVRAIIAAAVIYRIVA